MWYIHTTEHYSAIKRNKIGSFVMIWMSLPSSEVSQKEKKKSYAKTCMCNLENCYRCGNRDTGVENECVTREGDRGGWDKLGD